VIGGTTAIVVSTPGHDSVERSVAVQAGQKVALSIDAQSGAPKGVVAGAAPTTGPAPESHPMSPLRLGAYVAGGVGVLGLATATVAGLMANSTYGDLNHACGGGTCPADKSGEISSGRTQETVANVGLVLGLLGVGAGVSLYVLSTPKGTVTTTGFAVAPGWVGVKGEWQ
jgi:hypothetical protein